MGVETFMVDDCVEYGLERDMKKHIPSMSILGFTFSDPSESTPRKFILPMETEELIAWLFDMSTHKTIDNAYRITSECMETREPFLIGYRFNIIESKDGETTISPELVDCISKYGEYLKKR